jgi:hypothetical protein
MYHIDHKNLKAYDNFEIISDNEEILTYRKEKLQSTKKYVNLVKKLMKQKKINFLEIGSGNSKLLINLHKHNFLNKGFGFEISKNRIDFANSWVKDLGINNVFNINDNFINLDKYNLPKIDLCLGIDIVFQFVEPIKKNSEIEVLQKIYNVLDEKGVLVLELDSCEKILLGLKNQSQIWEEFEKSDPWRFSLWKCDFDKETKFLSWNKTYISRCLSKVDTSDITIKIYKKKEIKKLIKKIGFKKVKILKNSDIKLGSEYIVIAKK